MKFYLFSILVVLLCALAKAGLFPEPTLINATPADPKDWPASAYCSMGNSACTCTVVGEKVLLIAAHCVGNGGTAKFKVGGANYTSKCSHHPEYRGNSTADWAICAVERKVEGVPYENVNTDESRYRVGDELTLTGYGCVKPGGGGGNDGIYRVGLATIQKLPSGKNYDISTKGGAALCFGDSGGPVFKLEGTKRYIVGVNSRGDISKWSYLPAVALPTAQNFFRGWADKNSVRICGIHPDAQGCRDGGGPPPPPPPPLPKVFVMENTAIKVKVTLAVGSPVPEYYAKGVIKAHIDQME